MNSVLQTSGLPRSPKTREIARGSRLWHWLGWGGCQAAIVFVVLLVANVSQADDPPEALAGFVTSEIYDIAPAVPLDLAESWLVRSLYRIVKVSPESLGKFSQHSGTVSWQQLLQQPRRFRFWTFTRAARLKWLTILKFPRESDAGINGVYLATCTSVDGQTFFLVCRSAPTRLPIDKPLNQPIRFSGFFYNSVLLANDGMRPELKLATAGDREPDDDKPIDGNLDVDSNLGADDIAPVFVVNRFAWYPNAIDATGKVNSGQVELASRGVDIGLFDYVKKRNSKPLSRHDADAFWQILQATTEIGNDREGEPNGAPPIGFLDLVGAPSKHIGARVKVTGSLRQCVKIAVPRDAPVNPDVLQQHYYQVSLFPNLGGRKVVTRTGDRKNLSFDRYPVTVCLPKLPAGMTPAALAGKTATVDGFFYRLIKYQSQKTEAADQDGMVSPLVMATKVKLVKTATAARAVNGMLNVFLWLMLGAVALATIWRLVRWRQNTVDDTDGKGGGAFEYPERIDVSNIDDQNQSW